MTMEEGKHSNFVAQMLDHRIQQPPHQTALYPAISALRPVAQPQGAQVRGESNFLGGNCDFAM